MLMNLGFSSANWAHQVAERITIGEVLGDPKKEDVRGRGLRVYDVAVLAALPAAGSFLDQQYSGTA